MKRLELIIVCALSSLTLFGQSALKRPALGDSSGPRAFVTAPAHHPLGIASDWTQHHVLYPSPKSLAVMARIQTEPRWTQSFYLRHRESWWPGSPRGRFKSSARMIRDWNTTLGTTTFDPMFDLSYNVTPFGAFT